MNKNFIKLLSVCLICMVCFVSCERYPIRALLGLPDSFDSWPDPWYIYDDEINTKGSLVPFLFDHKGDGTIDPSCDSWNHVNLDFACTSNPKNGRKCISFYWQGNAKNSEKKHFSFGLQARENKGGKIDLTNSGYTYLKFWIRGSLNSNCSFEISIPNTLTKITIDSSQISPYWKEYAVLINGAGETDFVLSMSLKTNGITNGGQVYIDDIRFCKED